MTANLFDHGVTATRLPFLERQRIFPPQLASAFKKDL